LENIEKLKILLCLTFVFKASNYFSDQTDYSNKRTAYKKVDGLTDMKYEEKKERKKERKKEKKASCKKNHISLGGRISIKIG
jgi:hypothetical protein